VLYDALQAASARHTDYVIVDTAGRLHTKTNLMAELEKMRRTAQRIIPGAPHETLLVMDATTGQNGLPTGEDVHRVCRRDRHRSDQARWHGQGRVVVAISRELGVPVRYVGVGEKAGDLLPFDPEGFCGFAFCLACGGIKPYLGRRFLMTSKKAIKHESRKTARGSPGPAGPEFVKPRK
jgi:fused signal recognition particle receptor